MMCGVLTDEVKNMAICRKKHRNGPTGKVQLAWMEQYTKFASLARRS
jgi:replicative DNA helicase